MRPEQAIEKLQNLRDQGEVAAAASNHSVLLGAWKASVREVVRRSLGDDHDLVAQLDNVSYRVGMSWSGMDQAYYVRARVEGAKRAVGLIDAAIFALQLSAEIDEPLDEESFDSELWVHVRGLVADGDWGKVATETAVFTEDKVRKWSGQGAGVVGKNLYASALSNAGELRLGAIANEWEGWRNLGMGFAQATSNVDRHHVQQRADLKRYAVGVLGLASLLLTQMRYAHADLIEERDLGSS
ncbi:TIGR02391 family protein [Rhodococcoides fascians]|uniref:TIGR02391 family protein n=1 Tax=Rhodococcoides fascians TaxID=1828 RepID=UPI001427DAC8